MPLLYNHLLDSCKYVCKNTLLAKRRGGGHLHPLTPLKSAIVRKRKRTARVAKRREGRGRGEEEERSGEGRGGGEDGRRGAKELMNLL